MGLVSLRIGEVAALRWERLHPIESKSWNVFTKASPTIPRPMLAAKIPSESCVVFWIRRGSGQSIEIRETWFSPMHVEAR
jgi:hypothetical protein